MLKPRIVALALISIVLSSSSFSVADGYTIMVEVKDIKSAKHDFKNESNYYKINLIDNVKSSLINNAFLNPLAYKIKLFDSASVLLFNPYGMVDQSQDRL